MNTACKVSIRLNYEVDKVLPILGCTFAPYKGVPEMEVPQEEKIKGFQLYHEIYIKKRELFSGLNVLDT